ncbi:MAG: hypothetical protein J7L22_07795 [Candidatus Marinimicrobia bacterium]|nr:hypothetical protein [Candidatus Neomarinimicrobiota bacterium]
MKDFLRFFLFGSMIMVTAVRADINLWVMSFDNLHSDSEIKWLKEGFVDFIVDHYADNDYVRAYRSEKLDETLSVIKRNPAYQNARNYVVSGAYHRDKGEFIVDLQLTDLKTWETLAKKQVHEKSSDLEQLIMTVNKALDEIVDPRVKESIKTNAGEEKTPEQEVFDAGKDKNLEDIREMTVATKDIGSALDKLLADFQEKPEQYREPEPFSQNQFSQDAFTDRVRDFVRETHSFEQTMNFILNDPYEINIGEPTIQRLPMNSQSVLLSFRIDYRIKMEIVREMIETLKIKGKKEGETYIEYSFSGNDYLFTSDFIKRVAYGQYRYFPVVSLKDENGNAVSRIIDAPGTIDQIKHFNPMFNIAAGPWTMTIYLVKGVQEIDYELTLPIRTVAKISQVSIDMMTEDEIVQLVEK